MTDIYHIGTATSGRYPKGSGKDPGQHSSDFLTRVEMLKQKGLSEKEIAKAMGIVDHRGEGNIRSLRAQKSIAVNEKRMEKVARAKALKEKGYSTTAIAKEMGMNESSVRSLLDPVAQARQSTLINTADVLAENVTRKGMIDIGEGVSNVMGISDTKLAASVAILQEQGYTVQNLKIPQGPGRFTTMKVLCPPGMTWADAMKNRDKISTLDDVTSDQGHTYEKRVPSKPLSVNSKRVQVVYGPDGGEDKDGLIELRRGVEDVSLGNARYAQVRIAVDDSHYLKGMAVYSDDLPPGVDIRFNTNKKNTGNKLDAMKGLNDDPDSPFKSVVRPPRMYIGKDGKQHQSVINKVNDEGDWSDWSKRFSSQMLSKQPNKLVKQQLDLTVAQRREEYEAIMSLTNPVVRRKMLESFSDDADSAAVHLKAASLPRTANHAILPVPGMKAGEVFAPNYNNGDRVVLIRHPHGGTFEIPELVVNNRSRLAQRVLPKDAPDAIGIHPSVAKKLSGADFDGDSVLVIPNNRGDIKWTPTSKSKELQSLQDFDNRVYKLPKGKSEMTDIQLQREMGKASNLITDMTIKGASLPEITRAVKHSMVVIDSKKHELDYKQSEKDFGIADLKKKYQYDPVTGSKGAGTIVSRAKSDARVPEITLRKAAQGGPIDPVTGKKVYVETGREVNVYDKKTKTFTDAKTPAISKVPRLKITDDAYDLVSRDRRPVELLYADHSNKLKAIANDARKEMLSTPMPKKDPLAAKEYASEVASLKNKLDTAKKMKPLQRQVLVVADSRVREIRLSNPALDKEAIKKIHRKETARAEAELGYSRYKVEVTPREWEAIQRNAVSAEFQRQLIANANLDKIKELAMPRQGTGVSAAKAASARAKLNAGYTLAEVAESMGVSTTTLQRALKGE